ncbi:WD40 repeat-like protein [Auricularia subglabra TFB-10046 SS5]|uniref:WD40 repeat-like protein n=1 Tax=Auricularia subglabra (strain TFB-10046 / SS5) TaxID=717982 RepID=J0WTC1_AURST|nr:WD40 repeat-like protein [Auricularia subglabra TFB-10046 SS5]
MSADVTTLPYITVQPDFASVLSDARDGVIGQEDFWVSCYAEGKPSVHGKVRADRGGLAARDGVGFARDGESSTTFMAACPALDIPSTLVRIPRQKLGADGSPAITAFDVHETENGVPRVAVADASGAIAVHDSSSPSPLKTKLPRDTTASALRFFPSGAVLLCATSTYELRVLSASPAEFGATPRTLKGHRRAVTDVGMRDRGRTVLSCGKDGTLRQWDVSEGAQLGFSTSTESAPILKMAVNDAEGKAWLALGDGALEAHDLSSRTMIGGTALPGAALHAVALDAPRHRVAAGARDGVVRLWDARALGRPVLSWRRNGACVEDLVFDLSDGTLCAAMEDGLAYRARVDEASISVIEELVGPDCDPLRGVRVTAGGAVWTAADDGLVRKY